MIDCSLTMFQPKAATRCGNVAIEPEDQGIMDSQERTAVHLLARVRPVRGIHWRLAGGVHDTLVRCTSRNSATWWLTLLELQGLSGDRHPQRHGEQHWE